MLVFPFLGLLAETSSVILIRVVGSLMRAQILLVSVALMLRLVNHLLELGLIYTLKETIDLISRSV